MSTFLLTNYRETSDTVLFDLLKDGAMLKQKTTYMQAFHYLLDSMGDDDHYRYYECQEEPEGETLTGAQLRATHRERQVEIASLLSLPCVRCKGETTWIGYCDIYSSAWHNELQKTFFSQCGSCGYYRQIGFADGDDWQTDSYQALMQNRVPWVRVADDPFQRNGTLRITSCTHVNPMGRVNLDGHEYHCGEGITVYDRVHDLWRDGRVEYGDGWYFTGADGLADIDLRVGTLARKRQ